MSVAHKRQPVAEADVRAALAALPAGVVLSDRRGGVLHANDRARSVIGDAGSLTEALALTEPERLRRLLKLGRGRIETSFVAADGTVGALAIDVVPLPDAEAVCVMFTDLTAVRRLQEEMRRTDHLAIVGQLSAGLAHEIRNPLAGISINADLLRSRLSADSPHRTQLDLILNEVARLDRLSKTFLEYARPPIPRLALCSLDDCVSGILGNHATVLAEKNVRVQRETDGEVPPFYMDRDLILQALYNVIMNAVHAMPEGGTLTIHQSVVRQRLPSPPHAGRRAGDHPRAVRRTGPLLPMVRVRVTDTGHGIAPEILPRIFDPFFTTRGETSGTGLGLPITQAYVREHAGSIDVSSTLGVGTTVTIELPIEKRRTRGARPPLEKPADGEDGHDSPR